MRVQLDVIQQANSNNEENKSSCSQSHSSIQSFEEKSKEFPDSKPKSIMLSLEFMNDVF